MSKNQKKPEIIPPEPHGIPDNPEFPEQPQEPFKLPEEPQTLPPEEPPTKVPDEPGENPT